MKVVHVSTSDMGGAGIAAKRIHLGLLELGVSSEFLTLYRHGESIPNHHIYEETIAQGILSKITGRIRKSLKYRAPFLFKNYQKFLLNKPPGYDHFSFPYAEARLRKSRLIREADVIHLHWVADGMLDYLHFFKRLKKPVVWTLHDMNPFTGGCHHSDGSMEFITNCLDCIQIKGTLREDIAARNLEVKIRSMKNLGAEQVRIVTPSAWLGDLSGKSRIFKNYRHNVIPNPVDEKLFVPGNRSSIRQKLQIQEHTKVILFVANDVTNPRKGLEVLVQAINALPQEDLLVCTVGRKLPDDIVNKGMRQFGFVNGEKEMANLYAMSDVFVLPSKAENFPNSVIEALLCGLPVIASRVGGITEQITDSNGIMVAPDSAEELKNALVSILSGKIEFNRTAIREGAIEKYSFRQLITQYMKIYNQLITRGGN